MLGMPEDPLFVVLEMGSRELAFSFALALLAALLFGLPAALRASAVQPVHALKGLGDSGSSRRPMKLLLSAQVASSVTVLFVSGLFLRDLSPLVDPAAQVLAGQRIDDRCFRAGPAFPASVASGRG